MEKTKTYLHAYIFLLLNYAQISNPICTALAKQPTILARVFLKHEIVLKSNMVFAFLANHKAGTLFTIAAIGIIATALSYPEESNELLENGKEKLLAAYHSIKRIVWCALHKCHLTSAPPPIPRRPRGDLNWDSPTFTDAQYRELQKKLQAARIRQNHERRVERGDYLVNLPKKVITFEELMTQPVVNVRGRPRKGSV